MRLCYLLPDEAKDRESYRIDVRFRQHASASMPVPPAAHPTIWACRTALMFQPP